MDTLSVILAVVLGIIAILGAITSVIWFLIKFTFLPWLKTQLVEPMEETRKQVVENSHSNTPPTVLDRIDDVKKISIEAARHGKEGVQLAKQAIAEISVLSNMFDGHIDQAQEDTDRVWAELKRKANKKDQGKD